MNTQDIINQQIQKSLKEIQKPKRTSKSRAWQDPEGYRYLVQWSNSVLLRFLIRLHTNSLPKSEYRRKAQLDDAARSVVRNIEEGFKRATTKDYINFIGYSQGSLEEVKGDIRELTEDGFLKSTQKASLADLKVNLKDLNTALQKHPVPSSKNPLNDFDPVPQKHPVPSSKNPLKDTKEKSKDSKIDFSYIPLPTLYPPLKDIRFSDLSYEVFTELINKTDYLLRKLVISLEKKGNTKFDK